MVEKNHEPEHEYEPERETVAKILFNSIDYEIKSLTYGYTFTQTPVFRLAVTVKVPDELYPEAILLEMPISTSLTLIAEKHTAMVGYIQKTIDGFDDPHLQEELAFKALEEDGFDFHHFVRCILAEIEVELFWDPDMPPPTPQIKTVRFGDIDYKINEVEVSYGEKETPVFTFHVAVQLPKHIFEQVIVLKMPLFKVLEDVEKHDFAMANYVKKALSDNQNEPEYEAYTIHTLVAEKFDIHQFLRYALADFEFKIEKK